MPKKTLFFVILALLIFTAFFTYQFYLFTFNQSSNSNLFSFSKPSKEEILEKEKLEKAKQEQEKAEKDLEIANELETIPQPEPKRIIHKENWRCLKENEIGGYEIEEGTRKELRVPKLPLTVFLKNKETNQEIFKFQIDNMRSGYFQADSEKCGVYLIKQFNYDPNKTKQADDYYEEIWHYDFNGQGEKILFLYKNNIEKEKESIFYSTDFRVDPQEKYLALIRGFSGVENYSLIIKDLITQEDLLDLSYVQFRKKYPKINALYDFQDWDESGRFFWLDLSAAAYTYGFLRIDTQDWSWQAFAVPDDLMGGEDLNLETGWVSHHTDLVWTGVIELTEELKEERRKKGIGTKLYIYNLFTQEQRKIFDIQEPIYFSGPHWLSKTELEYTMPNGEKKIYRVK